SARIFCGSRLSYAAAHARVAAMTSSCGRSAVKPMDNALVVRISAINTRLIRILRNVNHDVRGLRGLRDWRLSVAGALRVDVDGVERLTGSHEEAVPLWTAERQVGAHLGKPDPAEQLALGRMDGRAAV